MQSPRTHICAELGGVRSPAIELPALSESAKEGFTLQSDQKKKLVKISGKTEIDSTQEVFLLIITSFNKQQEKKAKPLQLISQNPFSIYDINNEPVIVKIRNQPEQALNVTNCTFTPVKGMQAVKFSFKDNWETELTILHPDADEPTVLQLKYIL